MVSKLVNEFVSRFGAPALRPGVQLRVFPFHGRLQAPWHHEDSEMSISPRGRRYDRALQSYRAEYAFQRRGRQESRLGSTSPPRDGLPEQRARIHESTKYTPFYMTSGWDVKLPVDIMFGRTPDQPQERVEYARNLKDSLEAAHHLARTHLQAAQRRQKDFYDFNVGDRVLLSSTAVKRGLTLAPSFTRNGEAPTSSRQRSMTWTTGCSWQQGREGIRSCISTALDPVTSLDRFPTREKIGRTAVTRGCKKLTVTFQMQLTPCTQTMATRMSAVKVTLATYDRADSVRPELMKIHCFLYRSVHSRATHSSRHEDMSFWGSIVA